MARDEFKNLGFKDEKEEAAKKSEEKAHAGELRW